MVAAAVGAGTVPWWRRPWARWAAIATVGVTWLLGLMVTVALLAALHGANSPACPVPGRDSAYGTAEVHLVPLGLRCTYPSEVTGGRALPDGPLPGLGHLLVEAYLVGVPVAATILLVRRRTG